MIKLRLLLEDNTNLKITNVRKQLINWLKSEHIRYETNQSKTTSSYYIKIFFDYLENDQEFEEEVRIRFSNHPAGYNDRQVDIDLFSDKIYSLQDLFDKISKDFNLEIKNAKYYGLNKSRDWNNGWQFYDLKPNRKIK